MKKVLLATRPIVPPWDEASKNFAYFLGKEVQGHQLTLLTTQESLRDLPVSVHQEPIFKNAHFDFWTKLSLLRYLRASRETFDIVHYLFTPTRENTRLITTFAQPRGKTIQTIATLREDLYDSAALRSLCFANQLVTYTKSTQQKLEALGFTNVSTIYPGIDLEHYQPRGKDVSFLATADVSEKHFLAVYPGEYTRLGATNMLFTAFTEHFQKNPTSNIRFLFSCRIKNEADRVKRAALRTTVKELGLERHILFIEDPTITSMSALYNSADVVLFPVGDLKGKFDVPLVIIEAYACGKPVILSDLEAFREFSNDDIAVTVPRLDSQALIAAIVDLEQHPEKGATIGRAARAYTEANFDLRETAKRYSELYTSL